MMKTKKIPIKSRIKKKNRSSLGQAFHGAVMGSVSYTHLTLPTIYSV